MWDFRGATDDRGDRSQRCECRSRGQDTLHLKISLEVDEDAKRVTLNLEGTATFIQLPKLMKTLEKIPHDFELHVNIHALNYIDHACLDVLESWAEQHKNTGGQLMIEWNVLTGRITRKP